MRIRNLILKLPKKNLFHKLLNLLLYVTLRNWITNKVFYKPLTMDIEPTTGCNFRCTMCQVSSPGFKAKNMTLETFEKLIDQNPQLIKIKLQGMGEPLVNKNFFEMIDICDKNGVFVETVTNGSLLNDKNIDKIINSNSIYKVSISVDGSTKKTFEDIRVKSDFNNVINNIKNLSNEIKLHKKNINLRALCLIQKSNFHQFEEILILCKELGFDELAYQVQLTGWGKTEWEKVNQEKDINFENYEDKNKLKDILNKHNDKNFKASIVEDNILTKENKCSYPWHNPYISAEGKVVACCMVADPEIISFGDINKSEFNKIWNNKEFLNFRSSITNHKLRDFCKNCYREKR